MTLPRTEGIPTVDQLRDALSYSPETGDIYRKTNGYVRTKLATTKGKQGYLHVSVHDCRMFAHRVAWAMHYGEWPVSILDHINGDKSDNRIVNLRIATKAQNNYNRGKTKANTSGFKGVYWHKTAKRWYSIGVLAGKQKYLGLYDTPEQASEAYKAFIRNAAGDFAREE